MSAATATAIRVMYVGSGLSGRSTSLESVLKVPKLDASIGEHLLEVQVDQQIHRISAVVSTYRAWLWYTDPLDPSLDSRVVDELERLRTVDGFIFVVDTRQERTDASVEAFERLETDLRSRGRSLEHIPIVFQANWLDAPGAASIEWVRSTFRAAHAAYIESNAIQGVGTSEALVSVVRLVSASAGSVLA